MLRNDGGICLSLISPDILIDPLPVKHHALIGVEQLRNGKFRLRKPHVPAIHQESAPGKIHRQIFLRHKGPAGPLLSPEMGLYPGKQFLHAERLHDIIISAHLPSHNTIGLFCSGR